MKKVYVLLASGFELIEAMIPVDILRRSGLNVTTVSTSGDLQVESAQKVKVTADTLFKDVDFGSGDMIVLPGGNPGYINLRENKDVVEVVKQYLDSNKYVGAICGGPTVLGVNNLIGDLNFTCHFSVANEMNSDKYSNDKAVIVDNNVITSRGAGTAIEFGFELAKKFVSQEVIENVKKGMEIR